MPDMNENAETQQEYFGKAKLETDYKDLSMRLYNRIAELEKENADLKKSCDETQELLDKQIEATYKLDKENEELKEKNKWLEDCKLELADFLGKANDKIAELEKENESLTSIKNIYIGDLLKAKEIINTFLGFAEAFGYSPSMDKFISEAEQFLSEVEK